MPARCCWPRWPIRYARRHADDPRFTFGTGKLGDLAGFTSAIILAMIALLIGYESVSRLFAPVPIHFAEAIPIACLGLAVNIASAWLLGGGDHHGHAGMAMATRARPRRGAAHRDGDRDRRPRDLRGRRAAALPAARAQTGPIPAAEPRRSKPCGRTGRGNASPSGRSRRLSGNRSRKSQNRMRSRRMLRSAARTMPWLFEEHEHAHAAPRARQQHAGRQCPCHGRRRGLRAGDRRPAARARGFGWLWMDPLAGIIGAGVIASWAYGLIRDTGAILLDMNPDRAHGRGPAAGDRERRRRVADLHLWRLGPGHLGAIVSVSTQAARDAGYYRAKLARFRSCRISPSRFSTRRRTAGGGDAPRYDGGRGPHRYAGACGGPRCARGGPRIRCGLRLAVPKSAIKGRFERP